MKSWNGSFTVEAVFVVPIVSGILFGYILLVFFLHDQLILQGHMMEQNVALAEEQVTYASDREWIQAMKEGLWILSVEKGSIRDTELQSRVRSVAEFAWNIPWIQSIFPSRKSVTVTHTIAKVKPSLVHRMKGVG